MPENFTRRELAETVSLRFSVPQKQATLMVAYVLQAIGLALIEGRTAEFRGFGTLKVVQRKAKIGHNPANIAAGKYLIPPRRAVKFVASQSLFSALNPDQA